VTGSTLRHVYTGKVRDLYEVDDEHTLIVASDRVSVFDVVLPTEIPDKGRVLTGMSTFSFDATAALAPNHLVSSDPASFPASATDLAGRAMLVRTTKPVRLECIARGYLFGGAWREYREHGTVQGTRLPEGMREAEALPEALFTPTTKAEEGHDEPASDAQAIELLGADTFARLRDVTLAVYRFGAEHAERNGLILADTKLEFGFLGNELLVIDELLTPDSSRYWPADAYEPGASPPSFDKQYVRDYYLELGWDQKAPAPPLPDDVVEGTRARYAEAYARITGHSLTEWFGGDR